jgi:hypothetical protein
MAKIDVLMPVKNRRAFLAEAIDSIVDQTFSDWRLIILDHGSTDGSLDLAHRYAEKDARIELYSCPEVEGLAGLRNVGLSKCDCSYLLIQDSDDVSLRDRMAVTKEAFEENPNLLAVSGEMIAVDEAGTELAVWTTPADPKTIAASAFFYYSMNHAATAANFPEFQRLNARYGEDFLNHNPDRGPKFPRLVEDYMLFGQLALLGDCAGIPRPLIKYRVHGGGESVSNSFKQINLSIQVSRFLAQSFSRMHGVEPFDPAPFCSHAEHVIDLGRTDYTDVHAVMATAMVKGFGASREVERELSFRRILATRDSGRMAARYLAFAARHGVVPRERRIVRNWLLRKLRRGKYVYPAVNGEVA